jgi:hypothetical protein
LRDPSGWEFQDSATQPDWRAGGVLVINEIEELWRASSANRAVDIRIHNMARPEPRPKPKRRQLTREDQRRLVLRRERQWDAAIRALRDEEIVDSVLRNLKKRDSE